MHSNDDCILECAQKFKPRREIMESAYFNCFMQRLVKMHLEYYDYQYSIYSCSNLHSNQEMQAPPHGNNAQFA